MQLKHISDLSVFKATNKAVEIRLKISDRFLYMQHISGRQLSIYCKLQANGNTCYFVLTIKYVPSDPNNAPVQGVVSMATFNSNCHYIDFYCQFNLNYYT